MRLSNGFTLIELLVVITIIVVLLALLVPALDKAIYSAELAVCAASQRGIAQGVTMYAADHKRRYPLREALKVQSYKRSNNVGSKEKADDFGRIRPYVQPGLLLDTFAGGLDPADFDLADPDTTRYANYSLFFSWRYETEGGGRGSDRIGQGFTWQGKTYRALVSDESQVFEWKYAHNSHPGKDGNGVFQAHRDALVLNPVVNQSEKETVSRWNGLDQDVVDLTFAYDDLSVRRFDDAGPQAWRDAPELTQIPFQPDASREFEEVHGFYLQMLQ